MEILLDENVNDKQGVEALGIQTGDIIAMDPRTVITESGYCLLYTSNRGII